MQRHLVFLIDFDTRAHMLNEIPDHWEKNVKDLHIKNRENLILELERELGPQNFDEKLQNFKDAGSSPFSIISYHNSFYRQVRYSFIHGFYYPTLTSACSLGERILNHLIIDLRESFKGSRHYKAIYRKESFDDWGRCIDILDEWGVFQHEDVSKKFHLLKSLRMKSIHFDEDTYANLRQDSLSALELLRDIISMQFGFFSGQKWMISGTAGYSFIKKESENDPFIKKFYLPQCPLVGPYFSMNVINGMWIFFDIKEYEERQVTDAEFAEIFNSRNHDELANSSVPWPNDIIARAVVNNEIVELMCKV